MPAGASRFRLQVDKMIEIAELSHLAKDLFLKLVEEYRDLDARVSTLDDMRVDIGRRDDRCNRLTTLPGVGPIVANSILAAIDDGRNFASRVWQGVGPGTTGAVSV